MPRAAKRHGVSSAGVLSLEAAIHVMPKLHVHCHLEGTLRPQTFLELTERDGISTRYEPSTSARGAHAGGDTSQGPRDLDTVYHFADFTEFLLIFAAVSRALRLPEDYARMAREFVADARARNVVYGELFVSPSVWRFFHPGLDVREATAAIVGELRRASKGDAEFALIFDVTRNFGPKSAMETARLAAALAGDGVIGIGLGGDEARYPAELFADAFAFARAQGLHTVAHAGEAAGSQSVCAAIERLGAERIGHGIRALEDPDVVAMLVQRNVPLEICPTSNFSTGVADRRKPHPIVDLDAAGIPIVIDADDPALFGTSIDAEYRYVAETLGFEQLTRFVENAIEASFASEERKRALRERVCPELAALRRNGMSDAPS